MAGSAACSTLSTSSPGSVWRSVSIASSTPPTDVIDALSDLFILRGVPGHVRSDNGPEFIAKAVREWIIAVGARTAFIEPGSLWENGYCKSFNSKLRDEPLNGEIFYSLAEAKIIVETWRRHYNTERSHSSLGYKPPAPEAKIWPAPPHGSAPPTAGNGPKADDALRLKLDHLIGAGQERPQRRGIEVDIDDAPGRQTSPKPHGLHSRLVVDLEGHAGFEREAKRQDERTGDSIAIRSIQLDGDDALTVLLRLDLRQNTPFCRTFMNASDAPILIGLVK